MQLLEHQAGGHLEPNLITAYASVACGKPDCHISSCQAQPFLHFCICIHHTKIIF
ncbi:unnamed protein product [Larinioides sclopetarius]|uniref:Uncharacterized protein n=1 Tax=Larinioides sclopetarius TaxID=280406 RepID=A0AAV1ZMW7_9ARAC